MNRDSRIKLLKRIAAKKKAPAPLKGKMSKKDIQKAYAAAKKIYDNIASELMKAKEQLQKLQSFVDENEASMCSARETMQKCSDVLRNMDFACANDVRFSRDDVAYSVDGKWKSYNPETHALEPWKKSESDAQDVQDADVEEVPEEFGEGVEVTLNDVKL